MNFSKPLNFIKVYFAVLVIISIVLFLISDGSGIDTYGVNKTIGWVFDFCSTVPLLGAFSLVASLTGYFILFLFRLNVNRYIAVVHLIIVMVVSILSIVARSGSICEIALLLAVFALLLLIINFMMALTRKLGKKKSNIHP